MLARARDIVHSLTEDEKIAVVLAVTSQTMPTGNLTAMTQDERDLLGRWIAEGATTQ